jgi:hypothetical protein
MSAPEDFTKRKLWGGRFTGTTDPIVSLPVACGERQAGC